MTKRKYITTRDIVIPAGTEVGPGPRMSHYGIPHVPHVEILQEITRDSTAHWRMPFDEAVAAGLIAEEPGPA